MNKKYRILILGFLVIFLVVILLISVTVAFMKPIDNGENLTSVSLSNCAKIKLTETSSIDISNSYPMSRNKGLQTTPYSFTVTSYCDSYVGFNMYIAILEDSTIDLKNVHYVITKKDSKDALQEGLLSELEEETTFSENEKVELKTGIKGNFSKIYKLYSGMISLKGNREYDLYMFIDESATNDVMDKTFKAGVAIKSYDRDKSTIADFCMSYNNLNDCIIKYYDEMHSEETRIYHHDGTLENGIGDGSYRYAGASEDVDNFICFGYDENSSNYDENIKCPDNNLYRMVGIIDGRIKMIKYDYVTKDELGENGAYYGNYSKEDNYKYYLGNNKGNVAAYYWNSSTDNRRWNESNLNLINLNENFINYLDKDKTLWSEKIATTTWKIGGLLIEDLRDKLPKEIYLKEGFFLNENFNSKIALLYIVDYSYSFNPLYWTYYPRYSSDKNGYTRDIVKNSWLYMGLYEYLLTYQGNGLKIIYSIYTNGKVSDMKTSDIIAVRPVFFLNSDISYISGKGTKTSPIIIK